MDHNIHSIPVCADKFIPTSVEQQSSFMQSTPLKTYSKDYGKERGRRSPEERGESVSRYGRSQKLKLNDDFVSTDRKVSNYLRVSSGNQLHSFKEAFIEKKSPVKPVTPGSGEKRGRGRPRKIAPPTVSTSPPQRFDGISQVLKEAVSILQMTACPNEIELPPPTSTETLDKPALLITQPRDDGLSDREEEEEFPLVEEEDINEGDWNAGDLAWACVGGYPFWPCAITRDPYENVFRKWRTYGNKQPREFLHVRFFGDKGRRSWIVTKNVMPFHGLDKFLALAEETCTTPNIKKKDPKALKAFTVPHSIRKVWQAAVSEAESLNEAPRIERVTYFTNLFPPTPPNEREMPQEKPPPKKRGRKRNSELLGLSTPENVKRAKSLPPEALLDRSEVDPPLSESLFKTPSIIPATTPAEKTQPIMIEPHTPENLYNTPKKTPLDSDNATPNTETATPTTEGVKKRRGRPPGSNNKKKSPEESDYKPYREPVVRQKGTKSQRATEIKFKGTFFDNFYDEQFERLSAENPRASVDELERMIEMIWEKRISKSESGTKANESSLEDVPQKILSSKNGLNKINIKKKPIVKCAQRGVQREVARENEVAVMVNNSRSATPTPPPSSPPPMTPPKDTNDANLPSKEQKKESKEAVRKGGAVSLFSGVKGDKVCQVCLNGAEIGEEILRCRGPCGLYFHIKCSDKPRFHFEYSTEEGLEKVKKKRGRPRTVNTETPEVKVEKSDVPVTFKTEKDLGQNDLETSQLGASQTDDVKVEVTIDGNKFQAPSNPKRGRGRPKSPKKGESDSPVKVKVEPVTDQENRSESPSQLIPTKKGRGRPRKSSFNFCSSMEDIKVKEEPIETEIKDDEVFYGFPKGQTFSKFWPYYFPLLQENAKLDDESSAVMTNSTDAQPEEPETGKDTCSINEESTKTVKKDRPVRRKSTISNGPTDPPEEISTEVSEDPGLVDKMDIEKNQDSGLSSGSETVAEASEKTVSEQLAVTVEKEASLLALRAESSAEAEEKQDSGLSDSSSQNGGDNSSKNSDTESDRAKDKWMCSLCTSGKIGPCFICHVDIDEEKDEFVKCGYCNKPYHERCCEAWPQGQKLTRGKGKTIYHCPQHDCHTCISDNPSNASSRFTNDKLVRCLRCPATYHRGNYCIPAGTVLLSMTQLICVKHYKPNKKKGTTLISSSWCMICSKGGDLICCEHCPNSFHIQCVNLKSAPDGDYICEDCVTGRYPLFGEIVWAKLGVYRWWPARILYPAEIPANIFNLRHSMGEFAVMFFGSHDYHWISRGRCFLFHEGDGAGSSRTSSRVDELFSKALDETQEALKTWIQERAIREANSRTTMKPPKYVKIQTNKVVGNANKNVFITENSIQSCECDPDGQNPCGPNSDCINRLLSIECNPQVCPAGEKCLNQNFEKKIYPRLKPFRTENRGWGLTSLDRIVKGQFVIEYVGEIIDEAEYHKRRTYLQKIKDDNFYFLTIDKDRMLDAGPKGNVSRFMNHSCEPNCETQKWTVNGDTRIGLFALKNIEPGTELVFDYNLMSKGDVKIECKCGAPNCSGFIGVKNNNKQNGKVRQASTEENVTSAKKRKVQKVRGKDNNKLKSSSCFMCNKGGTLIGCNAKDCPKAYHLACLGFTKPPEGDWKCPRHQCSVCEATQVQCCLKCINSYCKDHAEGNISSSKNDGWLCYSHTMSEDGSDWSEDKQMSDDEEGPSTSNKKQPSGKKCPKLNGHIAPGT